MPTPAAAPIHEYFATVTDPRVDRTKLHLLMDILVMAICAVICGADSWVEMEAYGHAKEAWLRVTVGRFSLPASPPAGAPL